LNPGTTATPEPGQYAYVASKSGKVFHLPGCSSAKQIKPENLIGFKTREDAVSSGRQPCKRCKP
jgi:methylphosphotriester-DNA--protein-cysteine methyltransferase